MQLYPTSNAIHVAAAGLAVAAAGLLMNEPAIAAWGGAMIVGLAIARGVTWVSIARVRAAGFEMLWRESERSRRIVRGETVEIAAEVRNRDTRAARFTGLRAIASPDLSLDITPSSGEVPAGGRLGVTVRARADRVGRHAIFGLSLEVRGSPGLFEIPLTFANPFGIEVFPSTYGVTLRTARGGRSRTVSDAGRSGPVSGDGYELREIREHRAGDPLKRVAWKASARRGKLMVRDHEQEERDIVWLLVDASVELWAGVTGKAPLDHAIEEAAAVAEAHLAHGDHVGLAVCGSRVLARVPPARGTQQAATIARTLVYATGTLDDDRSGLDPGDVAVRVLEHARPLDPSAALGTSADDRTRVARKVAHLLPRAPFPPLKPHATDPADAMLRGYLSAFAIPSPPRLEPDRARADETIAEFLGGLSSERPRPSLVYVWSPAPEPGKRGVVLEALHKHGRRRMEIRWVRLELQKGFFPPKGPVGVAVHRAVALRAEVAQAVGERALRRLGVHVERVRPRATGLGDHEPPPPGASR